LSLHVAWRIRSVDVLDQLYELFLLRGPPGYIRSDNGPVLSMLDYRNVNMHVDRMCVFPAELAYSEGHLTVLDHGHHVVHCREIVERIPAHDDDVGELARLQRTDTITEPADDGRMPGGRL